MIVDLAITALAAFACCAGLIRVGLPYAGRLATATPNGRSSHVVPTPQSGGVFVVTTLAILGLLGGAAHAPWAPLAWRLAPPVAILAAMGWADDRYGLPVMARLIAYAIVAAGFVALRDEPFAGVTGLALVDGVLAAAFLLAFVNITNFMDGIDGMVVAEFTPMLVLFGVLAAVGAYSLSSGFVSVALAGALSGFFLFNRPKARIFLGDSGSLPIGFLGGALLLDFAQANGVVAALILPLYFLVDAGFTLVRRVLRGEQFWSAHRQHFYQRAFDGGQSNWSIIGRVALCNLALCGAALVAAQRPLGAAFGAMLACGAVASLARSLKQGRRHG